MSKYTTEVRYICEVAAGLVESTDYTGVEDVIKKALPVVFDFSFPIFDEQYRSVLETKILKHFYTREIGLETVGLWKLKLNTKLNEIMPYFNQLYSSQLYEFNPFYDVDLTRKHRIDGSGKRDTDTTSNTETEHRITVDETGNTTTDNTGSSTGEGTSENTEVRTGTNNQTDDFVEKYSDTPQGAITDLRTDKYLTNATIRNDDRKQNTSDNVKNDGKTSSNVSTKDNTEVEETRNTNTSGNNSSTTNGNVSATLTNTEDYLETVQGKNGGASYSKLLMEYRETFLNIDMMVIDNLEELFMQLW
nr:MAG TPA: Lower collar protein [Caudoviricetes sp.]